MKTSKIEILAIVLIAVFGFSCSQNKKTGESETQDGAMEMVSEISLAKAPPSPEFPDAVLDLNQVNEQPNDSGVFATHIFALTNYELGIQTEDADTRGIANSGKGQHIHFIVNNGPYSAHYMNVLNNQFEEGHWTILAFLSRSYHESVKSENAFYVTNMTVGSPAGEPADLAAPHLFYSRPKGTYSGADTQKVMLDFYLLNTNISPDGNKVRATINGSEFMIDEWAPYYIEGLPMGTSTIQLELIDADGNAVEGPFNNVTRTITLEE